MNDRIKTDLIKLKEIAFDLVKFFSEKNRLEFNKTLIKVHILIQEYNLNKSHSSFNIEELKKDQILFYKNIIREIVKLEVLIYKDNNKDYLESFSTILIKLNLKEV